MKRSLEQVGVPKFTQDLVVTDYLERCHYLYKHRRTGYTVGDRWVPIPRGLHTDYVDPFFSKLA